MQELEGLKEIVLPPAVPYTPQTPAWFILFGLFFLFGLWLIFRYFRKRKLNRYRKTALDKLNAISSRFDHGKALSPIREIPELVKWTALQGYSRERVANLSEERWLAFLDKSFKGSGFQDGPGLILPKLAYGKETEVKKIPPQHISRLIHLVRSWIRRHRV